MPSARALGDPMVTLAPGDTQQTPCDAWADGGGFEFKPVAAGIPMTLRVSAPGYADLEKTVTPSLGPQQAVIFAPSRTVGQ